MRKLIKSSIRCPDGTILTSRHRHDYQAHLDKNGELYVNDGGIEYIRRSVNKESFIDLSLYTTDSFEKLREGLEWATYGKKGDEELYYKPISNMSTNHINAVLLNCRVSDYLKELFEKEIAHRKECEQKGFVERHWEED